MDDKYTNWKSFQSKFLEIIVPNEFAANSFRKLNESCLRPFAEQTPIIGPSSNQSEKF